MPQLVQLKVPGEENKQKHISGEGQILADLNVGVQEPEEKSVVNIFSQYDQSYGDNLGDNGGDAQIDDDNKKGGVTSDQFRTFFPAMGTGKYLSDMVFR